MKHEVETQWMGKMQFNALVNGHTVIMDAPGRTGGEDHGPIPKPLILTALSGCTGMDIIAILRKNEKQVRSLSINIEGEISKQQPVEYTAVHIVYHFEGDDGYKEDALKAVHLSQERYCGVSNMLKKIMPVTWDVIYNGSLVYSNKNQSFATTALFQMQAEVLPSTSRQP